MVSGTAPRGMVSTRAEAPAGPRRRADALDALRGFAILTMALSGMIPFGGQPDGRPRLPAWMYHAQVPPPDHRFNPNLPGLTWVDLVFPFFLFALGAAIPLALARRAERGESAWRLAAHAMQRGLVLGLFSIYVLHIRPGTLAATPDVRAWLTALAGFAVLFPALARLPATWPRMGRLAMRAAGWAAAIAIVIRQPYEDGQGLNLLRSDIIIVVLANMALFGTLAWLVTRDNLPLRFGLMLALIAVRLAHVPPGWVHDWWELAWVPGTWRTWLHTYLRPYYLQYLLIVLPGTMLGDLLLGWLRAASPAPAGWQARRCFALALLAIALHLLLLVGLQARWLTGTTVAAAAGGLVAVALVRRPRSATEHLLAGLVHWGSGWLLLGLLCEPYEGGIKKDSPTLSYYFVTAGLACFALLLFTIVCEVWRRRRWLGLLIGAGQNPMIAYAGVQSLVPPLLNLAGLERLLARGLSTPWLGVLHAGLKTLLLAALVSLFSRLRVFWRT